MKVIADGLVALPYKLHFCAEGPEVDPLTVTIDGVTATLCFPPSLGEGTDGKGLFGEWAWWTGTSLRVVLEMEAAAADDSLKVRSLAAANTLLRRFLNACRVHFDQPQVHPVTVEPSALTLYEIGEDGSWTEMEEANPEFFFDKMPAEPPLGTSINSTTLDCLRADVESGAEQPLATMLRLDVRLLRQQGEDALADALERFAQSTEL